jgi:steroid delta-isomerase-like uncharacterized protein
VSIEENKAIVRRMFERPDGVAAEEWKPRVQEGADPAAQLERGFRIRFSQMFAPDYVEHGPRTDISVEELIKLMPTLMTAFPDLAYKVEDIFAEGDKVVARYTARGTHLGRLHDVPPSGKKIEINGIYVGRIADGKIAEGWFVSTFFSFKETVEQLRLSLLKG